MREVISYDNSQHHHGEKGFILIELGVAEDTAFCPKTGYMTLPRDMVFLTLIALL